MADTAITETPTTEVAPETAPDTAVIEPVVEETGPVSKHEARRAMLADREVAAAAKKALAEAAGGETPPAETPPAETPPAETPPVETPPAETPPGEEPPAETPPGETPPAETPPAETPSGEEPPAEKPTGRIAIDIDPNHPVRGMGLEKLSASSVQEERVIRALLNGTYTRRQELQERDKTISGLEEKITRIEANQSAQQKWQGTEEYKKAVEHFNEIKETVGDEAASAYWKGVQGDFQAAADKEFEDRWSSHQAKEDERLGREWADEAWRRTARLPQPIRDAPNFSEMFKSAIESFNAEIRMGHYADVKAGDLDALHEKFVTFLGSRLVRDPGIQQAFRAMEEAKKGKKGAADTDAATQERQHAEIARKAVEEYKQEAAKKRTDTPLHPLGTIAGVNRGTLPSTEGGEPDETADLNVHDLKRQLKAGARKDSHRHVPQ